MGLCSLQFSKHVIWENIQIVRSLLIHSHNNIQVFIEVVPQFRFHEKKNGNCLLIFHWTQHLTITIFANLKNSGKECCKMWKANKVCKCRVRGLTWNDASITTTLDCIKIFKILYYRLRTFANRITKQILVATKRWTCLWNFDKFQ